MKIRIALASIAIALSSSLAYGGAVQPAPVSVDEANMTAIGGMVSARFSDNDVEFIGCGVRYFDDGLGGVFGFAFCQATDSAGVAGFCSTTNLALMEAIHAIADFSFITFSWNAVGECTRIGNSTQSFYLPEILGTEFENHTHEYLTGQGVGHNNTSASTSAPIAGE